MADKSKILELDISTDSVLAKSVALKTTIANLRDELDKLKKSGDTNSETYVKMESALKKANTEFTNNQKVMKALSDANGNFLSVAQKVDLLMNEELTTLAKARASITDLTKLRDQLNVTNKEEAKLLEQLNYKINENNKFIKENSSELEVQKINIGAYKDGAVEALTQTGLFTGTLGNGLATLKAFSPVFSGLKTQMGGYAADIKNSTKGTEEMTVAQKLHTFATLGGVSAMKLFFLAIAATGIGLLVIALSLLISYFKTVDPVVDKVEQGMAAFGAAIRVVQQALAGLLSLDFSGFDNIGDKMNNAAKAAANLKKAQQDLEDQMNSQEVANAKASQQYDELILKSRNRTLTEKQRIDFLQKAEKIETENYNERTRQAKLLLAQAVENARINANLSDLEIENLKKNTQAYGTYLLNRTKNGIKQEDLDALKNAQLGIIAIDAENTKRLEKNQNSQDKLAEDAKEKRDKAIADAEANAKKQEELRQKSLDNAVLKTQAELRLYLSLQGSKAKSLEDSLKIAETTYNKELEIAQKTFEASKKTEADKLNLQIANNDTKNKLIESQLGFVLNYSKTELDLFVAQNQSKLEGVKLLNQSLIDEEKKRLNDIALDKINILEQEKKTNQGIIDAKIANNEQLSIADTEYLAGKISINNETDKIILANQATLDEQLKAQRAAQLQADNEIAIANAQTKLEADLLANQQQYDAELVQFEEALKNKELTQAQYDAKVIIAKKKVDELDRLASINSVSGKLQEFQKIGAGIEELFGKSKASASAMAIINGGLAVMEILKTPSTFPEPFASISRGVQIATVVGTTAKNIQKINSAKLAQGDILSGPSHANGGIPFTVDGVPGYEAEGGEAVINKRSTAIFRPLLSAINEAGGGKRFASGGMATTLGISSSIRNAQSNIIDYDVLAVKIAQANQSLPSPVLSYEDFHAGNSSRNKVITGANH